MKRVSSSLASLALALAAGPGACLPDPPASSGAGSGAAAAGSGSGATVSGDGGAAVSGDSGFTAADDAGGVATPGSPDAGATFQPDAGSAPVMSVQGPQVTITEFVTSTDSSSAPGGICAGPDGRIWFLHQDTGPNALGAISIDGSNVAVYKTSVTGIGPIAINPGPDGNVWYTKQQGIGKMDPSGSDTEYGSPQNVQTGGITKGPDGNMWYTEPDVDRIGNVSVSGQTNDYPLPGTGRTPDDITLGPDGNLWVTEQTGNNIARVTPSGVVTEYPIPTPASNPQAITAGPDGNLWFTEHDAHNIGRITPTGTISEFGIPSGARPYKIAAGPDGNLWFTEPGSFNAIGRCTPTGGISEYPIPTPNTDVQGITAGPDGNMWFAEMDAEKVGRVSNLTGGGNLSSATGPLGTILSTSGPCTKDTDCVASGQACGGDVCSYATMPPSCVLAVTGDPGSCNATSDCWCAAQGATCDSTSHHCSTTTP